MRRAKAKEIKRALKEARKQKAADKAAERKTCPLAGLSPEHANARRAMEAVRHIETRRDIDRQRDAQVEKAKRDVKPGPELRGVLTTALKTPKNAREAAASPQCRYWAASEYVEFYGQMIAKGVLSRLIGRPPNGRRGIPGKFVYKIKMNKDGTIFKFKARFVAQGFRQRDGYDFDRFRCYAPVASMTSVKALVAEAANSGKRLFQFDVEGAFLLPDIKEEVYVVYNGVYYRVHKTLYGLKQAAHEWNQELDRELKRLGFRQSKGDPCLYTRKTSAGTINLVVWVDDVIGSSDNDQLYRQFMRDFRFPYSSSGSFDYALKILVEQADGLVHLHQKPYITALATKFNVLKSNPKYTPMEEKLKLSKADCPEDGSDEQKHMAKVPYRELLGCLYYAAGIRGDIENSVNKLSRYASNPAVKHWDCLKRVLVYLYTTRDRKLTFGKDKHLVDRKNALGIMVDADHGGCLDTLRSTSGILVKAFRTTILSKSKRQGNVSNSTGAAELYAIALAVRKIDNYRIIMEDLGCYQDCVTIQTDSQVAVSMIKRGYVSEATKHLAIAFHTIKERVDSGAIKVIHVPGTENTSDILTKSLPRITHEKHTNAMLNDKATSGWGRHSRYRSQSRYSARRPPPRYPAQGHFSTRRPDRYLAQGHFSARRRTRYTRHVSQRTRHAYYDY